MEEMKIYSKELIWTQSGLLGDQMKVTIQNLLLPILFFFFFLDTDAI